MAADGGARPGIVRRLSRRFAAIGRWIFGRRVVHVSVLTGIFFALLGLLPLSDTFDGWFADKPLIRVQVEARCDGPKTLHFVIRDDDILVGAAAHPDYLRKISNYEKRNRQTLGPLHKKPGEESMCSAIGLRIEGDDEELIAAPEPSILFREKDFFTEDEMSVISRWGGAWRGSYDYYMTNRFMLVDPAQFMLTGLDSISAEKCDSLSRYGAMDEGEGDLLMQVNDKTYCVSKDFARTKGDGWNAVDEYIEGALEVLEGMKGYDASGEPVAPAKAMRIPTGGEMWLRTRDMRIGVGAVYARITCRSCKTKLRRNVMFDIEAEAISSPMGEETFVISSNNGFRAQPIRQMADGRYRVVALNREGFFNRDFWALISSILLGVGITILVEQVISTLTRRRAADQRR